MEGNHPRKVAGNDSFAICTCGSQIDLTLAFSDRRGIPFCLLLAALEAVVRVVPEASERLRVHGSTST